MTVDLSCSHNNRFCHSSLLFISSVLGYSNYLLQSVVSRIRCSISTRGAISLAYLPTYYIDCSVRRNLHSLFGCNPFLQISFNRSLLHEITKAHSVEPTYGISNT